MTGNPVLLAVPIACVVFLKEVIVTSPSVRLESRYDSPQHICRGKTNFIDIAIISYERCKRVFESMRPDV